MYVGLWPHVVSWIASDHMTSFCVIVPPHEHFLREPVLAVTGRAKIQETLKSEPRVLGWNFVLGTWVYKIDFGLSERWTFALSFLHGCFSLWSLIRNKQISPIFSRVCPWSWPDVSQPWTPVWYLDANDSHAASWMDVEVWDSKETHFCTCSSGERGGYLPIVHQALSSSCSIKQCEQNHNKMRTHGSVAVPVCFVLFWIQKLTV